MADSLRLELESFTLSNGLEVHLQPDPSAPLVAVNLWYRVGARNERPGGTGLAHLCEHLMFEGSLGHDDDYFRPLQEVGGAVNGSTSRDRTQYHEVVPPPFLELALWMEADRLARLRPALTDAKLENQRRVVINERRQRYENRPYGMAGELMAQTLYPEGHPYSWPVIGHIIDLERFTRADVDRFLAGHYRPDNANLVIAGGFDPGQARDLVERHFAGIVAEGAPAADVRAADLAPVRIGEARSLRLEDRVALPRLDLCWTTGPRYSPDEAALDFVAAILAGRSRESRLKRRLVREERLVSSVSAGNSAQLLAGEFDLVVYLLPGRPFERVEELIHAEIAALAERPPDDEELERVRNDCLNSAWTRIETALGRTSAIAHRRFFLGSVTPTALLEELDLYRRITAADVSDACRRYLLLPALSLRIEPPGATGIRAASVSSGAVAEEGPPKRPGGATSSIPTPLLNPAREPVARPPRVERGVTSFGMPVLHVQMPAVPRLDAQLLIPAGSVSEPVDRFGIARLTANLMDEGTRRLDSAALVRQLDRLGARLGASFGVEWSLVALRAIRETREQAFALFAESLLEPRFAAEDFDRERQQLLAALAQRREDPDELAEDAIDDLLFGADHPYARSGLGTETSLAGLSRDLVAEFHADEILSARPTLVTVGPDPLEDSIRLAERHLSAWPGCAAPTEANGPRSMAPWTTGRSETASVERSPPGARFRFVSRPNAAQAVLRVGRLTVPRSSPDHLPLVLANGVLGGQFVSRLNSRLREERGVTYGARSGMISRRFAGSITADADVDAASAREAVDLIHAEFARMAGADPVHAEELAYIKAWLRRRFPARFETPASTLGQVSQLVMHDLPDDHFERWVTDLDAVTLDAVRDVSARRLDPAELRTAVVGPPELVDAFTGR
jgi:zinc protease